MVLVLLVLVKTTTMLRSRWSRWCRWSTLVVVVVAAVVVAAEVDFGYREHSPTGPENWGRLDPAWATCSAGREQSPVHIRTDGRRARRDLPALPALNFSSYAPSPAVLFSDGHALTVDVVAGAGSLWVDGREYELRHFHFHSPSEHVIDGVRPPLEMHMVHESLDGDVDVDGGTTARLAVIGVPFKDGPPSPFLDEFWREVPRLALVGAGVALDIGLLVVDAPHLRLGPDYARYRGSLTTPPCTQDVLWTVSLDHWNTISPDQIRAFRQILPEPSARPTQKLHGRHVYLHAATESSP